jgi:AraC-like DNA-binding protein
MVLGGESRRNALFTELLHSIHVRSSVFARPELRSPWGFTLEDEEPAFHIVTRGRCWLTLDGPGEAVELAEGDFAVLPRGGTHTLRDTPSTKPMRLDRSLKDRLRDPDGVFRAGGDGAATVLVCGNFRFDGASSDVLIRVLPPVIHVKRKGSRLAAWLAATMRHVQSGLDAGAPAADAVVARIADILFIQAVATYLESNASTAETGWLGALRDREIGAAIELLHEHPERPWTVESLARALGLSRSAFAARFMQFVGEPPLGYLTRVRLAAAAERLRSGDEKVSTIASSLGYESVSGFNKAFKQRFGATPGAYRGRSSTRTGAEDNNADGAAWYARGDESRHRKGATP